MKKSLTQKIKLFRKTVWGFYQKNKRPLPWRKNITPYKVLVSEIMLQQTQVDRVIPKFLAFTKKFPTVQSLARAPLAAVLATWSGLGYNRRALFLHRAAQAIVAEHGGKIPSTAEALTGLPGIGPHTAGAILAYAYNSPTIFIETNIRAVFLHHFFAGKEKVHDLALVPIIEASIDRANPREWYSALMDYGTRLKKEFKNPSRRSAHHTQQSKFEGSNRQIRGRILQILLAQKIISEKNLIIRIKQCLKAKKLLRLGTAVRKNLVALADEGMIIKKGTTWIVAP